MKQKITKEIKRAIQWFEDATHNPDFYKDFSVLVYELLLEILRRNDILEQKKRGFGRNIRRNF